MRILRRFFAVCLSLLVAGSVLAEVRPERLWLSGAHNSLRPLLTAAAYKALENPDCNDVLYGRLNEYRTEHVGTAFTILCMKDARTTFNLVFYASELGDVAMPVNNRDNDASRAELERLRQMLGQPVTAQSAQQPIEAQVVGTEGSIDEADPESLLSSDSIGSDELPETLPPPEIF